jgi:hypothetical protein
VEEDAPFRNTCLGENKNIGHRYGRDLKPLMTVLARASSSLADLPGWVVERKADDLDL